MGDVLTGASLPPNQKDFYEKLNVSSLGFAEDDTSVSDYLRDIQTTYNTLDSISERARYVDENGTLQVTDPSLAATAVAKFAIANFEYGQKGSLFYKICTKEVPNKNYDPTSEVSDDNPKTIRERVSLEGDTPKAKKLRKKAEEALKRDYIRHTLSTDLKSDDPVKKKGARDALCKMAGATIMEQSELGQIVTQESVEGHTMVLNQNDILRAIGKARTSKGNPLVIEPRGLTYVFKFKCKDATGTMQDIEYQVNLERSKGNATMSGKIRKDQASKIAKKVEHAKTFEKEQEESTLHQFLRGQMNLLESILNQSKHSLPL